jgi:hypothetical protein
MSDGIARYARFGHGRRSLRPPDGDVAFRAGISFGLLLVELRLPADVIAEEQLKADQRGGEDGDDRECDPEHDHRFLLLRMPSTKRTVSRLIWEPSPALVNQLAFRSRRRRIHRWVTWPPT